MDENFKCDICGAPATVHLTQIVDGKIHKVHLCEKCAAKSEIAELPVLKFTEMIAKTLAAGGKKPSGEDAENPAEGRELGGRAPKKICPRCGLSDVLFEKKNLLGCPHCYEVFSEKIEEILPKIQKGKTYRGTFAPEAKKPRVPAGGKKRAGTATGTTAEEKPSSEALRKRLADAVAAEDYALAARLRDEIYALEKPRVPAGQKTQKKPTKKQPRVPAKKAGAVSTASKRRAAPRRSRGGDDDGGAGKGARA